MGSRIKCGNDARLVNLIKHAWRRSRNHHWAGDGQGVRKMDMSYSAEELEFQQEVRGFLASNLPKRISDKIRGAKP